jgi:hypothetical protein
VAAAEFAGKAVLRVPGIAGAGCGVAGAAVLWGAGWALLVAAGFLLELSREIT